MKPTDEERRKVAARLRNMCTRGCRYAEQFYELLKETVMDSWDFHDFHDVADRLAELIEPQERTCRAEKRYCDDGSSPWPHYVCSECGERLHSRDVVTEYGEESCEMLPFCAGCGARVEGAGQ